MKQSARCWARAGAALGIVLGSAGAVEATPLSHLLVVPAETLVQWFSGLPLRKAVPMVNLDAEEAKQLMAADLEQDAATQDLDGQVELMSSFGFLPPRTNLKETYLNFMGQQAAAFYSPKTGKFYNVSRLGPLDALSEAVTLAHELTHAAQDQAVGLTDAFKARADDDDQSRALQWVVEGHATVVGNRAGGLLSPPLPGPPGLVAGEVQTWFMWSPLATKAMALMTEQGDSAGTPEFLRDSTFSAYAEGSRFVWNVERHVGRDTARRVLCQPPRSTEETLHLDKYLSGSDPPLKVGIRLPVDQQVRTELTMGEWGLAWLLRRITGSGAAGAAAAGWGGDRMALLADGGALWRIVMDDVESAARLHWALAHARHAVGPQVALRRVGREVHLFSGPAVVDADALSRALASGAVAPIPPAAPPAAGSACAEVARR